MPVDETRAAPVSSGEERSSSAADRASTTALLGVPIGDRDLVRAALTWNLAVETARLGRRVVILAPATETPTFLWPEAGVGPLGTELVFCPARNLADLAAIAAERVVTGQTSKGHRIDALFVCVPPAWLEPGAATRNPIPWWLLMSSPNHRDLSDAFELAAAIHGRPAPGEARPTIGLTIHGVSRVDEAKQAYEHVSRRCSDQLGFDLLSYGMLVDDLHVYRAIAALRPIGLAHPQAPATRALMDVARLLSEDAGMIPRG